MTLLLSLATASAGPCDPLLAKANSTPRAELPALFAEVARCDKDVAASSFDAFMRVSNEVDVLVDLSNKAIEAEIYNPVWDMLERIPDYTVREQVARRVGAVCQENVGVLPFLRGGYYAMNERAFGMWSEAFVTCGSQELTTWLTTQIADPPARTYDAKYSAILAATVERLGEDALGPLERAAIAASDRGGPFTSVLEKMQEAVTPPEMGATIPDGARQKLAISLVRVGQGVRPEQAALVADRLNQTGHPVEAAGLLAVVYGDRVQPDGRLMYGLTSVEHCGGEAVVHVASVYEPSKRWSIQADVEGPARAFKPRLKCETPGPWPVLITGSPVRDQAELDAWVAEITKTWTDKKLVVRERLEKPLELP
jgi:hypothetical protein